MQQIVQFYFYFANRIDLQSHYYYFYTDKEKECKIFQSICKQISINEVRKIYKHYYLHDKVLKNVLNFLIKLISIALCG